MTVRFIGGPVDEKIVECYPCQSITIPVLICSELRQIVYLKAQEQSGQYLNSPVEFVLAEFAAP